LTEWQAALDQASTGIVLGSVSDLRRSRGYLPLTYCGHRSGFEWYYGTLARNFTAPLPDGLGDRSHAASFVTHSDLRELICAVMAGAVLASLANGLMFDENTGGVIDGNAALERARRLELKVGSG
jgi:hypothetical protein